MKEKEKEKEKECRYPVISAVRLGWVVLRVAAVARIQALVLVHANKPIDVRPCPCAHNTHAQHTSNTHTNTHNTQHTHTQHTHTQHMHTQHTTRTHTHTNTYTQHTHRHTQHLESKGGTKEIRQDRVDHLFGGAPREQGWQRLPELTLLAAHCTQLARSAEGSWPLMQFLRAAACSAVK